MVCSACGWGHPDFGYYLDRLKHHVLPSGLFRCNEHRLLPRRKYPSSGRELDSFHMRDLVPSHDAGSQKRNFSLQKYRHILRQPFALHHPFPVDGGL